MSVPLNLGPDGGLGNLNYGAALGLNAQNTARTIHQKAGVLLAGHGNDLNHGPVNARDHHASIVHPGGAS